MKEKKGLIGTLFSYLSEIVFLIMHIAVFYILPGAIKTEDNERIVVIQFFLTFILGLLMGGFIRKRTKFYYAFIVAIVYLPSIFIIFSKENILFCLWIFIASFVGVIFGQLARKPKLLPKKVKDQNAIEEKKARKQAAKDRVAIEALDSLNEIKKVGDTIPAEFDITDSDIVPDVETPVKDSFGKRFIASLKRAFAKSREQKMERRAKKSKSNNGVIEGYSSREVKDQGLKEEFCKDYKPVVTEEKNEKIGSKEVSDDGQKAFFNDEYRQEGGFLFNHKVSENNDNNSELKTSVDLSDKND